MLTSAAAAFASLAPSICPTPTSQAGASVLEPLDSLQDEPGSHYAVVRAIWSGRWALSTVAAGDEGWYSEYLRMCKAVA
jgi:hypothetical protein